MYLRSRPNPYSQTDDEGYLINPNDGSSLWYHFLTKGAADLHNFEFQMGDFAGSDLYNETYFAGHPASYEENFIFAGNDRLTVRIRIGGDCTIFDARDLFREVPEWVIADITRAFNKMDDVYEPSDILFTELDGAVSQRTLDYLNSGDLGETLNLWRENEVHHYEYVRLTAPRSEATNAEFKLERKKYRPMEKDWAGWLVSLWMLNFGEVHKILMHPEIYPILDPELTKNLVGWLERENCDSLSPKWNSISVAIAHNPAETAVGYVYVPCLDETKIEIVKRERRR